WPERWLFLQALALLPITAVALRLIGFRRWQSLLARRPPLSAAVAEGDSQTETLTRLVAQSVSRAARFSPYTASCLQRSLVLCWLLRRQGVLSDLRIGVRRSEGRFEAHAWVEYRGTVLNDPPHVVENYTPFGCAIEPAKG